MVSFLLCFSCCLVAEPLLFRLICSLLQEPVYQLFNQNLHLCKRIGTLAKSAHLSSQRREQGALQVCATLAQELRNEQRPRVAVRGHAPADASLQKCWRTIGCLRRCFNRFHCTTASCDFGCCANIPLQKADG